MTKKRQSQILFKFLCFRLRQIGRVCKETGWLTTSFLILLLLGIIGVLALHLTSKTYLWLPLYLVLTLPFQLKRRDHAFLRKLTYSKETIFLAEYNVVVLRITLILFCYLQIGIAVAGHLLVSAIAFIPSNQTSKKREASNPLIQWIPNKLFEWRCFFRKHLFYWPIIYLLSALLSPFIFAVPLGLLLLLLAIPEGYNYLEPKELIQIYPRTERFLWAKLRDHSLFIHLLFLPLYVLFLVFHHQLWFVLAFFVLLIESSICFGLVYKYAQLGVITSNVYNSLPFLVCFGIMILFFPAVLFYIYSYWKRATKALQLYA